MDWLYKNFVENKQKAIAGAVLAVVSTYVAQYGFNIETLTVAQVIEQVVFGVLGYVGVYLKRNQK